MKTLHNDRLQSGGEEIANAISYGRLRSVGG